MSRFFQVVPRRLSLRRQRKLARVADEGILPEDRAVGGEIYDPAWDAEGRRNGRHLSRRVHLPRLLRKLAHLPMSISARLLGLADESALEMNEGGDTFQNSRLRVWFAPQTNADQLNYLTMQSSIGYAWLF